MRFQITKDESNQEVIYSFSLSLEDIAKCEFNGELLNKILNLDKSPKISDQLEVLLEYFHAIEGTDRKTLLKQYLDAVKLKFELEKMFQGNSNYATYSSYATARVYPYTKPKGNMP